LFEERSPQRTQRKSGEGRENKIREKTLTHRGRERGGNAEKKVHHTQSAQRSRREGKDRKREEKKRKIKKN